MFLQFGNLQFEIQICNLNGLFDERLNQGFCVTVYLYLVLFFFNVSLNNYVFCAYIHHFCLLILISHTSHEICRVFFCAFLYVSDDVFFFHSKIRLRILSMTDLCDEVHGLVSFFSYLNNDQEQILLVYFVCLFKLLFFFRLFNTHQVKFLLCSNLKT